MDWNDFAKRLTLELSRLPVKYFLIVQGSNGLPYVQAMRSEGVFDAEAVGNAFLPRPLAPSQERRLRTLGWEPPDEDERHNWWQQYSHRQRGKRASGEILECCALLAGLMVGALRDAYGIGSPLELVYQASRVNSAGEPLALPGLGIPPALPQDEVGRATERARSGRPAQTDLEAALTEARERGDQQAYLELLARAVLYLPSSGDSEGGGPRFATARFGDGTFVLAFTSPEAMEHSLQGQAVHHRQASLAELSRHWPQPDWQLAINPGLPSASYLDANALLGPIGRPPAAAAQPVTPSKRRAARPRRHVPPRPHPPAGEAVPPAQITSDPTHPSAGAAEPAPASAAGLAGAEQAVSTPVREPAPQPASTPAPVKDSASPSWDSPAAPRSATTPTRSSAPPPPVQRPDDEEAAPESPGRLESRSAAAQPRTEAPEPPVAAAREPGRPRNETSHDEPASTSDDGTSGALMAQKVIRAEHVYHYLDGGYDLVAGYVHRLEDARDLTTPAMLFENLDLSYDGSPFTAADDHVFVIRWPAVEAPPFRPPVGGDDEPPGEDRGIPEFRIESRRLPHRAELHRLTEAGASLVATYDADLRRWLVRLPGGRG